MVTAVISLIVIFILLIFWIVFVPVYIQVNSDSNLYEIRQPVTFRFLFHPGVKPAIEMFVFGIPIKIGQKKVQHALPQEKTNRKPMLKRSVDAWLYLLRGSMKSFQLKTFTCTVDFDDVFVNAQLVPVALLLSKGPVHVNVNFNKNYYLNMVIVARGHRMIWAFIRFLTKKIKLWK